MISFLKITNERTKKRYKAILVDLAFWAFFSLSILLNINREKYDIWKEVKEFYIFLIPLIIVVYVHSYLFSKFFLQRKYNYYIILCSILIASSYYVLIFIYESIIPGTTAGIFSAIILFILMHTGFRYLIVEPKQSLKIKEEEAKRVKAERDLQELEAKQTKAELEFLKSQINPHFLFNSLNGIYSLTMQNSEKAGEAILTLSDLLRYNLESAKKRFVTLSHEIEFLDNYIELESMRLGDNCKISITKNGEFQTRAIAPLILMPFVENCFKHGIGADKTNNHIQISITLVDNKLTFSTENRVALSRMNNPAESIKIGIENVKRRLEMVYPQRHTLDLSSENNIYKVFLQIEL